MKILRNRYVAIGAIIVLFALAVCSYLFITAENNTSTPDPSMEDSTVDTSAGASISESIDENREESVFIDEGRYAGTITDNSDGSSAYINNQYKFSLDFPTSWRVGDNGLGRGTFQLMNYLEEQASNPAFFKDGQTKIEMAIIKDPFTFHSGALTEVKVSGQRAWKTDRATGDYPGYIVTIPSLPDTYLTITMYGKDDVVLESLVQSIEWL